MTDAVTRSDNLTPAQLTALQEHERSSPTDESLMPHLQSLATELEDTKRKLAAANSQLTDERKTTQSLRSKLSSITKTASRLAASEVELSRQLSHKALVESCVPFVIGGRNGYHPHTLDIHLEEMHTARTGLLSGFPQYIAWVPVPIWPFGKRVNGYIKFGETRILDSGVFPSIARLKNSDNNDSSTDYFLEQVNITGYASIGLNDRRSPSEQVAWLDRTDSLERHATHGDPDESFESSEAPPFIPSLANTQPTRRRASDDI